MAERSFLFHILVAGIFSLLFRFALSRSFSSPESSYATAVLDVSASIQRATDVLSLHPRQPNSTQSERQEVETVSTHPPSSSSPPLSLSLHSRVSLYKPQHKDYSLLTLSRLDRDSARVQSLNSKLNFTLHGFNRSELKPVQVFVQPEDLEAPLTSGSSQGSGEYFSRVGVGQPAKSSYLVIDTGSDVSWLQCEPCSDCYQQSDPIFNPSASTSYRRLSCDSQQCSALETSACIRDGCAYQVSYGDGSYTVGDFSTETLSFGSSGSVDNVAIGCGHDNEGLFVASDGLLGLGGGGLSFPSQIKASSFSYCLVNRDSTASSTLEFNSAPPGDSVTAPLLRNSKIDTFRYVAITGLSVGGQPVSIPPSTFQVDESGRGGIIVDSGTAVTRLQAQAYESLRNSFTALTRNLPSSSGFALFDTCYDLSSMESVRVPTVGFILAGGKTLSLPPHNYLIPVDSAGKFCFAFAPTQGSLSIVGNVQQQGTRVTYDLANSLVSFSPNKC